MSSLKPIWITLMVSTKDYVKLTLFVVLVENIKLINFNFPFKTKFKVNLLQTTA